MAAILECVPNFSEGRDMAVIKQITDRIQTVEGVKLLNVDPGASTNRTVVTFVGPPDAVCEAAFLAAQKAAEVIDMRKHKGEHPRFGAIDVCPLVPISGITMEETVILARKLAQRIGEELGIHVYCYEYAAYDERRKNLAYCRAGEYEGLHDKLASPDGKPDFGPTTLNEKSGAVAVGARDFLVAYNVNLNTTSTRRANAIAFDVREKGRIKREGDPLTGKIIKDADGKPVMIPGSLKNVKAIGWYIEEYGIAQISINLTNIQETPVHVVFEEVCQKAEERGVRVTGSELVGLIPLQAMLDAGTYFLKKQQRSTGIPEKEIIKIAVKSLGLNDLAPFNPDDKIIEYAMQRDQKGKRLADLTVADFIALTCSEAPAPGGGSVAACMGSLGAALAAMVANLSAHKRGWDERWQEFSDWAEQGKTAYEQLLRLVDEDTLAFNNLMQAFALPKNTEAEKAARKQAIQQATRQAIEIPFRVMTVALDSMTVIKAMAETGNPNSISDAGVAALAARSAVLGAFLNVKINAGGLDDKEYVNNLLTRGREMEKQAIALEWEILKIVNAKIGS
ncbi:MAG TPA: glutamate formimidoyltransferase [bacterium]|nr:glutamate formimidoyltransferase [bacterium]HPN45962.1 glutamate formimidoyltransferase [bacterium]